MVVWWTTKESGSHWATPSRERELLTVRNSFIAKVCSAIHNGRDRTAICHLAGLAVLERTKCNDQPTILQAIIAACSAPYTIVIGSSVCIYD